MDQSVGSYPPVTKFADIDGRAFGAAILDRAAVFATGGQKMDVLSFCLPGDTPLMVLFTDLAEGQWVIKQNGKPSIFKTVEKDAGVMYEVIDPSFGLITAEKTNMLISHYEFQGDLKNSVADAGDGAGRNGAASTCSESCDISGDINSCFANLNGNGWIHVGYPAALDIPAATQQISIAVWLKTSVAAYTQLIGRRYEWRLYINNGKPIFSAQSAAGTVTLVAERNVCDNLWHHIVATYDADTGTATIYIDGAQAAQLAQTSPLVNIVSTLRCAIGAIASSSTAATNIFDGFADDIRVYGDVLSATQAKHLYDTTKSNFCANRPQTDYSGNCRTALDDWGIFASKWLVETDLSDLNILAVEWLGCGFLDIADCR
jgi:hypothetical protein